MRMLRKRTDNNEQQHFKSSKLSAARARQAAPSRLTSPTGTPAPAMENLPPYA